MTPGGERHASSPMRDRVISAGVATKIARPSASGSAPTAAGTQPAVTLPPRDPSTVLRKPRRRRGCGRRRWRGPIAAIAAGWARISGIVAWPARPIKRLRHPPRRAAARGSPPVAAEATGPRRSRLDHRADRETAVPPRPHVGALKKLAGAPIVGRETRGQTGAARLRAARYPVFSRDDPSRAAARRGKAN